MVFFIYSVNILAKAISFIAYKRGRAIFFSMTNIFIINIFFIDFRCVKEYRLIKDF